MLTGASKSKNREESERGKIEVQDQQKDARGGRNDYGKEGLTWAAVDKEGLPPCVSAPGSPPFVLPPMSPGCWHTAPGDPASRPEHTRFQSHACETCRIGREIASRIEERMKHTTSEINLN